MPAVRPLHRTERGPDVRLEVGDELLVVREQPAVRDEAAPRAGLGGLDQRRVLGADLVVEREELRDPLLGRVRREEVVQEPVAAAGRDRPDRADREVRRAGLGLDVDALQYRDRQAYELRANWKIAIENYLECYHCAINHPGFVDAVDDRALRLEAGPTRLSQFAPVHARALERRKPYDVRGALDTSQFHILLPAMKLNVCPGHPNLSIGPVWPLATDRCAGYLDYFFAPGLSEEWIAEFCAWDFQVGAEDIALVEGVQAGAASGAIAEGHLLEVTEGLIAAFQAWVRARVEPDL